MAASTAPLAPKVGAEPTADRIREDIVSGEFAPGQRLVEADLSESYQASRGAVRNALQQLEHEGLVERIANRGARVRVVSVEEAVAITEVRMVVEGLVGAKAAQNATPEDVAELREIGAAMQAAVAGGEIMVYSGLNVRLHDKIRVMGRQDVAEEVLGRLLARNVRHQFRLALRPGRPQVSLPEHLAIIEAVCAGDPAAAEAAVREHVASVIRALQQTD
ncbi:GntR family transcriptional regulator [Nocardioides sp. GY 10127]|uniref:GntR family transcriptional regulator n=1 Tax=Nocardioides sp. GY 10127 TaxID=2569762 RepID=UPI0010A92D17|nr:GntR family transcriptional regulator [Nocardioides sp. GY 10127]TIC82684.1 GntR family transcriptional regulator [Nocardioides sp. GY 10127]